MPDARRPENEWKRKIRGGLRVVGLVGFTTAMVGVRLGGRVLALHSDEAEAGWRDRCMRFWARGTARLIGMKLTCEESPPEAPSLVVANHLSYVDIVVLWATLPGVFIAKSEIAAWPLIGSFGRTVQTLFIDRERKRDLLRVIDGMQNALAGGDRVFLFAEGTSSYGASVLPFKSSLFEAAVRAEVPVACAALAYRTQAPEVPADMSVCWWGDMTFPDHVFDLLCMRGFEAHVRFAPKPLVHDNRKTLARGARASVEENFVPSRPLLEYPQ